MTLPTPVSGQAQERGTHAQALALFDGTTAVHNLPARSRRLLALAAACYDAARQYDHDDDRADRTGRDLALAAPIVGMLAEDQAIVASVVALQRDKLRPNREPAFLWLGEKHQHTALALAAILRVVGEIDADPAGQLLVHIDGDATTLTVGGQSTAKQVARVEKGAELWQEVIGPLVVQTSEADRVEPAGVSGAANGVEQALEDMQELPGALGLPVGGEPIAEVARRMLRRFFDKLLAREDAVIKGEDVEDIHQMRVATRRLRASLQVVEGIYDPKLIRRYRRGLRKIAESLGAVRDGDVFLEHVVAYRDALPEAERAPLDALVDAVAVERAGARKELLKHLGAKRYDKLKRHFAEFLTTPGAGVIAAPAPALAERVRDFAGSAIWRRYEQWRAYEVVLPNAPNETLHQARIAGKRFRYTLEFFAEALGSHVEQALTPLIALQENLGALQDGVTAREHIAALGLEDDAGARAYLAARDNERATLLAELPGRWEKVASATYRRRLFEMIVKL